jgi:O-antigen ligase
VGRTADRERIDSSRLVRAEEALELIEEDPVFGVGPGLYVVELVDRGVDNGGSLPPHNAVLHSGAETGVVGAALSLVLFGALALWALSGGPLALIAAATLAPFHLLDSYPHVFPRGIVISGFWIGVVIVAHRRGLHGSLDASR